MTIIVNDSFSGADANPIGGIYTTLFNTGACQRLSHLAQGTVLNSFNEVGDTTNSYSNDQYAQITLAGTPANAASFALLLRISSPTTTGLTLARWLITQSLTTTQVLLGAWNGSNIGSPPTLNTAPAAGDVYFFSVSGQVYSFYQNGTLLNTYTDAGANVAAGSAGFGFFCNTTALANSQISNFQSGQFPQYTPFSRTQFVVKRKIYLP